ncbi:MAG: bifunctional phosphoribosyl-AMP cyclohydrolase/phosphoribosyl-ATP diphosphatase HisIE [Pyrinomonadaceae bacterium]
MKVDFAKFADKLAPAIVQDARTGKVLMLGYMNAAALKKTRISKRVTFYSRSKNRLWTKGETSGNFMAVEEIRVDCDADALLIKANPAGAICHTGADTCFNEKNESDNFLSELEQIIWARKSDAPGDSYTAKLFTKGLSKISQKVGEEAVEVVIAALAEPDVNFKNEVSDLLYHLLVLLAAKETKLAEVLKVLQERKK